MSYGIAIDCAVNVSATSSGACSDFFAPNKSLLEFKLKKSLSDWQSAELAAANRLSNNQKRNIDLILESGWHQQKIIGEILDRALIQRGRY